MAIYVLVVEDNQIIQKTIQQILKKNSVGCTLASYSELAKSYLSLMLAERICPNPDPSHQFKAVILDNQFPATETGLPEEDEGLRLLSWYQKLENTDSSLIFISSSGDPDTKKFEGKGFSAIVPKPLTLQKIQNVFLELGILSIEESPDLLRRPISLSKGVC